MISFTMIPSCTSVASSLLNTSFLKSLLLRDIGLPLLVISTFQNKKHLKNVGPIRHCEPPHALILHCHSPGTLLSHAACASMSTTTTTTTRDRGDRYGRIEWAQRQTARSADVMKIDSRYRVRNPALYSYC